MKENGGRGESWDGGGLKERQEQGGGRGGAEVGVMQQEEEGRYCRRNENRHKSNAMEEKNSWKERLRRNRI